MIRVEAETLQEAYSKAAGELSCSVVDLEINIIQNGSGGFLGLFKKKAIIEVQRKGAHKPHFKEREEREVKEPTEHQRGGETPSDASFDERKEFQKRSKNRRHRTKNKEPFKEGVQERPERKPLSAKEMPVAHEPKFEQVKPLREVRHTIASSVIDQNFHQEKREVNDILDEVRQNIKNLFKYGCFTLDTPLVSKYDEETILIEFSGEDAALLIGKEGYRYKALSYLLYNWINLKYGLNIRLEIAEFLKNQEEMIEKYLVPVIERIRNTGKGQTKILDGVLIKIALEALRTEFPEKYVGIKSGKDGGKFIVVNDFNRKNA
ncbi:Jag N-terminal domain-containing protein [Sulfurospirillum cavolei]|jgi:spoIIIJ-associated protein|uniref:Jag N-terminal domain-containing protein n=1 Tax=Sulfurospirillum cavolei TaxID=366522 RepID=UPI000A751906